MKEQIKNSQPHGRKVGQCYVFMRDDHDWHACEVAVLCIKGELFTVARASDVCQALLGKKRKLKTWTCTHEELW